MRLHYFNERSANMESNKETFDKFDFVKEQEDLDKNKQYIAYAETVESFLSLFQFGKTNFYSEHVENIIQSNANNELIVLLNSNFVGEFCSYWFLRYLAYDRNEIVLKNRFGDCGKDAIEQLKPKWYMSKQRKELILRRKYDLKNSIEDAEDAQKLKQLILDFGHKGLYTDNWCIEELPNKPVICEPDELSVVFCTMLYKCIAYSEKIKKAEKYHRLIETKYDKLEHLSDPDSNMLLGNGLYYQVSKELNDALRELPILISEAHTLEEDIKPLENRFHSLKAERLSKQPPEQIIAEKAAAEWDVQGASWY